MKIIENPNELIIPQHRLCLVNLNGLFSEIGRNILADLTLYGLDLTPTKISRAAKKLYYHHLVKYICDYALNNKTHNKIIFWYTAGNNQSVLDYVIDLNLSNALVDKFIMHNTDLPVKFYKSDQLTFHTFVDLHHQDAGEYREILETLKVIRDAEFKHITFSRIKGFATRNKLTFLTEQYFNDIKFGQLLFA